MQKIRKTNLEGVMRFVTFLSAIQTVPFPPHPQVLSHLKTAQEVEALTFPDSLDELGRIKQMLLGSFVPQQVLQKKAQTSSIHPSIHSHPAMHNPPSISISLC